MPILNFYLGRDWCKINENEGGICLKNVDAAFRIENCIIQGNLQCGIKITNSSPGIYNNLISNNTFLGGTNSGGGISLDNASPHIYNNTIAYNNAEKYGGGIYCANGSSPIIINSILYGNICAVAGQIYIADNNSNPRIVNNINQSNTLGMATGVDYNWGNYKDNLDLDPEFIDVVSQNYHLNTTSPCIDRGMDATGLNLPDLDLDGNPRIYSGIIDIGCYEYQGQLLRNL